MRKILIIGSSYIIKNTFKKKFSNDEIKFCGFRKLWDLRNIEKFDIIIASGFHREILYKNKNYINEYTDKYYNFIKYLSVNCDQLYLISTFIPNYFSLSRIVFFYRSLILKSLLDKKVNIISFPKIIEKNFEKKIFFIVLKLFKIKLTNQDYLINNTEKFFLKSLPDTRFFLLNIPRIMFVERLIRLLDIDKN